MERDRSTSVMVGKLLSQIDDVIGRAGGGEPVRLKRGKKVVAVLVSPEDAALLAREKREMEADARAYKRAKREIARDGSHRVPWERVKQELAARKSRKLRLIGSRSNDRHEGRCAECRKTRSAA